MWSYYADGHKGCMVEFENVFKNKEYANVLKNVDYVEDLNKIQNSIDPYQKYALWKREKEIRAVYSKNNNIIWIHNNDKIFFSINVKKIYLGCAIGDEITLIKESKNDKSKSNKAPVILIEDDYQNLIDLIKQKNIKLYKMKLSNDGEKPLVHKEIDLNEIHINKNKLIISK